MKKIFLAIWFAVLFGMVAPMMAQDAEETPEPLDTELLNLVTSTLNRMASLESYTVNGDLVLDQTVTSGATTVKTDLTQELLLQIAYTDGVVNKALLELEQAITIGQGIGSGTLVLNLVLPDNSNTFYVDLNSTTGLFLGLDTGGWRVLGSEDDEVAFVNEAFGDPESLLNSFNQPIMYPINDDTVLTLKEGRPRELRFRRQRFPTRQFNVVLDARAVFESGALDSAFRNVDASSLGMTMDELLALLVDNATLTINLFYDEEADYFRMIETTFSFTTTFTAEGHEVTLSQTATGSFEYTDYNVPFTVSVPGEDEPEAPPDATDEAEGGE